MNDSVLNLGGISIYGFGLLATFAFLWGSFVFYKKASDSHLEDYSVFDGVVLSAFWALITGRISYSVLNIATFWGHFSRVFLLTQYPGIDKWGVLIGVAIGIYLAVLRVKAKFLDWFDFVSLGISSGMTVFYAGISVLAGKWQFVLLATISLACFSFLWKMENIYRTLSWYRNKKTSAKSGFISGFSISFWGLVAIFESIIMTRLSLVGIIWGLFLIVGGFVLVYIRSGRTVNEDIKIIFKNGKK